MHSNTNFLPTVLLVVVFYFGLVDSFDIHDSIRDLVNPQISLTKLEHSALVRL